MGIGREGRRTAPRAPKVQVPDKRQGEDSRHASQVAEDAARISVTATYSTDVCMALLVSLCVFCRYVVRTIVYMQAPGVSACLCQPSLLRLVLYHRVCGTLRALPYLSLEREADASHVRFKISGFGAMSERERVQRGCPRVRVAVQFRQA